MADDNDVKEFTNAQLARGIAFLMNEIKGLSEGMAGVTGRIDAFEIKNPAPPPAPAPADDEPPNLEEMGNTDLFKHLLKTIKTDMFDPMQDHLKGVETDRAQKEAVAAVNTAAAKYEDFGLWDKEIAALVEEHPTISVDDAYFIARQRSPEKTKQIDDNAAKAAADAKGEEETEGTPFGGLLPTSSVSAESTQMDVADAGEAAWDKEMGDFVALIPQGGGKGA